MAMFGIRFDMRNPEFSGVTMAERYAAALDMAEWADGLGAVMWGLSEHHASADGYLPSPLTMAAAAAARTKNIRIAINAIPAPFHDPLRLAEDIAVVDQLSKGRLDIALVGGYVHEEFAMFGVPLNERPKRMTELVQTLKAAWTGEPFEFRGRTVRVTPTPFQPGGPNLMLGGSSEPAARRAARIGDAFMPSEPHFWDYYRDECLKLGKPDPGPGYAGDTRVIHLATDVDKTWDQVGQYFLHETNAYGEWQVAAGVEAGFHHVDDVATLRAEERYRILTPDELAAELKAAGDFAFTLFHPMVGGIPPALAWESLKLYEHEVLPQLG
jgi:alkanesulfonate monooxygenase SsuD/methylene tetrahydromethanopterin reductase-like flavin-dependent oxidoreductase (luciferase family)